MSERALISVILATYNWPQALRVCLQSLMQQNDLNFEVIIADDGSSSETTGLIQGYQSHFPVPLHHVWQEDLGFRKSKILNQAISTSRGDYLIFLDGDCLVQSDFIAQHRSLMTPHVMVTGSRILIEKGLTHDLCQAGQWNFNVFKKSSWRYRLKGQLNKCLPLWFKWPFSWGRMYSTFVWRRIKGCNMAAWREDILQINGFDESLEGWGHEDADFVFRLQQIGVQRKSGSWATEVLHLWHPSQNKDQAAKNAALVRAKILAKSQR